MKKDFADIEQLLNRFQEIGIETKFIPNFMKDLANTLFLNPDMNFTQVNEHFHSLGWDDVELDFHTFELARKCLGKK